MDALDCHPSEMDRVYKAHHKLGNLLHDDKFQIKFRLESGDIFSAKLDHWLIAFYIGFIMQPITYGCFYYVLKNNPLYKVLPIVTMGIPPTGLLAAIFLLGEKPTLELFIGGSIIIVGVIMIVFRTAKKKEV